MILLLCKDLALSEPVVSDKVWRATQLSLVVHCAGQRYIYTMYLSRSSSATFPKASIVLYFYMKQ